MVAQLPVVGVARVVVAGTASGIPIQNIFHVEKTSSPGTPWSDAALDAVANQVGLTWDSYFAPTLNTSYTPGATTAIDLGQEVSHVANRPNISIGIASGAHVPQSMCCCISWHISRHYRGGHPRTYVGPLGDASILNQTSFSGAFLTSLGTAAGHLINDTNTSSPGGATVRLVVVHRWRNKVKLDPPQVSPILSYAIDNRLDTQRRRLGPDR